jgi:hypothetical protein
MRGEEVGEECGRVNIVHILCTHISKWKMIPIESISGMVVNKGEWCKG